MTKKLTWELVFENIEKNQPIRHKDIQKNLNLTQGQVSGAIATIRKKGLIEQSPNKSYMLKKHSQYDFLKKDLEKLLDNYPEPNEKEKSEYNMLYSRIKEALFQEDKANG